MVQRERQWDEGMNKKSGGVLFWPKSGPLVVQRMELDGFKSQHCSGEFERSEAILKMIQFNLQWANINSLFCKHLILSEQLIPAD